jgi:hypothetical protein
MFGSTLGLTPGEDDGIHHGAKRHAEERYPATPARSGPSADSTLMNPRAPKLFVHYRLSIH